MIIHGFEILEPSGFGVPDAMLLTVKILYNMDDHMNEIIERSVLKRPLESSNVSNEFAVKKPALVNPLQETNKLIPQSIKSLEIYE